MNGVNIRTCWFFNEKHSHRIYMIPTTSEIFFQNPILINIEHYFYFVLVKLNMNTLLVHSEFLSVFFLFEILVSYLLSETCIMSSQNLLFLSWNFNWSWIWVDIFLFSNQYSFILQSRKMSSILIYHIEEEHL